MTLKYLLALSLLLSGCATLEGVTDKAEESAEVVDQGAKKLRAVVSQLREGLKKYATLAVWACGESPLDAAACKDLDALAGKVADALDQAQAALDLYEAGKGDFIDAYETAGKALELAEDYASKVVELVERSRA